MAESAVLGSAVIVLSVYSYRKLVEPVTAPVASGSTAARILGAEAQPAPLAEFVIAYGFAYFTLTMLAMSEPGLADAFAWLIAVGAILANGTAVTGDLQRQLKGEAAPVTSTGGVSIDLGSGASTPAATPAAVEAFTQSIRGAKGFVAAPGTDYTAGKLPAIAKRLNEMGRSTGIALTGISGYRSPAHSAAVGGFPNDPHTRGEASDTQGAQYISRATLNKYGLERPFPGVHELDHIQLLGSVNHNGGY